MRRIVLILILLMLMTLPAAAQENLLTNGGLEQGEFGPYLGRGRGDLNIAAGWNLWLGQGSTDQFYNRGDKVYAYPHLGPGPNPLEGGTATNIHGGFVQFNAAMFQSVSVPVGTSLVAEAASYLIACSPADGEPGPCPSDPNSGARTRIGIDPDGGDNPNAPEIVWSAWLEPHDNWGRQKVRATSTGGQVTVFLSMTQNSPQVNNFAFWDDAKLYAVEGWNVNAGDTGDTTEGEDGTTTTTTTTGESSAPVATAIPTVPPPPTAIPYAAFVVPQGTADDDGLIHVVQQGDTFDSIAYAYGLTRDELKERNPDLRSMRFLKIGQEIIIETPTASEIESTATLTPTLTITPAG